MNQSSCESVDTARTEVGSTRGTRLHILPTPLAHDVALWTRGDGELTWNLETDRTLQVLEHSLQLLGSTHCF